MEDQQTQKFLQFMARLISGESNADNWREHAVSHYKDEHLETIRRLLVGAIIQNDPSGRFDDLPIELKQKIFELQSRLRGKAT